MAFRVDITELALADIASYVSFLRDEKKEPEAAERWFRGLLMAIYSLEETPERFLTIPESRFFRGQIVRHQIYHSHRIVYEVDTKSKVVTVHRVYHGARRRLSHQSLFRNE